MKTVTVKLPDALIAEIASAAKTRKVPKSEIIRERLARKPPTSRANKKATLWAQMEDLVICTDSLPKDLSLEQGAPEGLWPEAFSLIQVR